MQKYLTTEKIKKLIHENWLEIVNQFNISNLELSSEKALVFNFAWNLNHKLNNNLKNIDFERQLFHDFSDGTFLDLYFEIDTIKIGIEFKFPRKSFKGNSNQTQTRIKCINDIKRISHLVNKKKIDLGVFLMATDEKPYIYEGKKQLAIDFRTYHQSIYLAGSNFPVIDKYTEEIVCQNEIRFNWLGINNKSLSHKIAWLEPIFIS